MLLFSYEIWENIDLLEVNSLVRSTKATVLEAIVPSSITLCR